MSSNYDPNDPATIRREAEERQRGQLDRVEIESLRLLDYVGSIIFNRGKAKGLSAQAMSDIQDHLDMVNGRDLRHIAAAAALVGNTLAEVMADAAAGKRM